ncbi:MAG: ATP-dependent DNA ligase [Acidobacteria bacterium]|nr:ATP-dependent DNA ligase [Acidobacteriota bacterium]
MQLRGLVDASAAIAATNRRLVKIEVLSGFLAQLRGDEIDIAVAFLSGEPRQGKVGIGYKLMQQATAPAAHAPSLTLLETDAALTSIAATRGSLAKAGVVAALLEKATQAEQQFLIRLLTGELRQGALEGIMVEGVASAARINAERLRRAVMLAGNLAAASRAALEHGEAALTAFDVQLFRPVQPMLAQSAEDAAHALGELGDAAFEYKLDGARIQVHRDGDAVRVFTRALNDVTLAVPEVVEAALSLPVRNVILDGEVLALRQDRRPHPFQVTMRRFGRKLDVALMRGSLPLTPFFFDALYLDGGSLLDEPQSRRFQALADMAPEFLIPNLHTADAETAAMFVKQAIAAGHEGVMAKALNAPYAAGARGQSWLKIKQARTLDLVILAAEWGSGRRKGWLSNLHLGARDPVNGGFAMLGKTFKGLTDEMLVWQTAELLKHEVSRDSWTVYVEPRLVAEIAFNEIQTSPHYPSGLALRFARIKRYRSDKTPEQSDTFQTVQALAGVAATSPTPP